MTAFSVPAGRLLTVADYLALPETDGEFGYADAAPATGVFETEAPFPLRLDLDQLASW